MKKLLLGLIVLSTIVLISCDKEENGATASLSSEEEAIVANDATIETVVESSDYEVDLYSGSTENINQLDSKLKSTDGWPFLGRYLIGFAPTVTVETTDGDFPKTITVDYGDSTVLHNGTVLSGVVTIVVTAPPRTDGAQKTVTYTNFYVDSINIAGSKVMTYSINEETGIIFSCVGNIIVTFSDGTSITRESEKTKQFAEGYDTPGDYSDDVFEITGYVNSTSSEGYTFSATIQEPLIKLGTCRYIVQGIVEFSRNGEVFAELNYGNQTCDDIATITKDGEETQITLGKRHRIRNNHLNGQ
jgi:hypothetical protein